MRLGDLFEIKLTKKTSGATDKFMSDVYATTDEHPFSSRERIHNGEATFEVSPHEGAIHISDIRSLKPKSGAGTRALNHLKSLADKHGVELKGDAKAYHNNKEYMNTKQLKGWYSKNGFKVGRGDDYDGHPISYKPSQKKTLGEALSRTQIYNNTTPNQMKAIARNSDYKTARFTVTDDGKYHASDANFFTHDALSDHSVVRGFIKHHGDDKFSVTAWLHPSAGDAQKHPAIKRLIKSGISHRYDTMSEDLHDRMPSQFKTQAGQHVDIYKNPTRSEVEHIVKNSEAHSARGIFHGNDVYMFDGMKAIHHQVSDHLGLNTTHVDHFNVGRGHWVSEYIRNDEDLHRVQNHPWIKKTIPKYRFFHS